VLVDDAVFLQVAAALAAEDFSLEKHRRIFSRMNDLYERGERIDRITLAEELMRQGQLESVDGFSYVVSLDDGMPKLSNLDGYVRIVKDKALLRKIIFTSQKIIDRAMLQEDTPDEILSGAEESLMRMGEARASNTLSNPARIIEEFQGGLNAFLDPSRRIKGVATGLTRFDELTGGLHGGELFILAARPAMGKTALALNMAQYVATRLNGTVAVFSLEMSKESLLTRMMCAGARVDQQKFRAGYLSREERQRLHDEAERLIEAPLFIDDTPGTTVMDVHAKLRRLKNEHGLALVVIDYLQLMSSRGKAENRNQEISAMSRALKLLAGELQVPFLVLSQLSRAPEQRPGDHKPQLSDLRESGSIEQDADLVAFIYRAEVYKPEDEKLRGLADLILAKQRNGPTGVVKMVFLKEFTKFENRTSDMDEPSE
jgi:replicative DNA helicase